MGVLPFTNSFSCPMNHLSNEYTLLFKVYQNVIGESTALEGFIGFRSPQGAFIRRRLRRSRLFAIRSFVIRAGFPLFNSHHFQVVGE